MVHVIGIEGAGSYSSDGLIELKKELLDILDYAWTVDSLRAHFLIEEIIKLVDQQIVEEGRKGA